MLNRTAIRNRYHALRAQGYSPREALRNARIAYQFAHLEMSGLVRLRWEPDEDCDLDDLKGATFNRSANPDIQESRMAREEKAFEREIEQEGVWGCITEFCEPNGTWQLADSCWGLIGQEAHDYTSDLQSSAIAALRDALQRRPALRRLPDGRPMLRVLAIA